MWEIRMRSCILCAKGETDSAGSELLHELNARARAVTRGEFVHRAECGQ